MVFYFGRSLEPSQNLFLTWQGILILVRDEICFVVIFFWIHSSVQKTRLDWWFLKQHAHRSNVWCFLWLIKNKMHSWREKNTKCKAYLTHFFHQPESAVIMHYKKTVKKIRVCRNLNVLHLTNADKMLNCNCQKWRQTNFM